MKRHRLSLQRPKRQQKIPIEEAHCLAHSRRIAESQDALLNICGRVSLDMYINAGNSGFKPVEQVGGTCYANAVATVLHLAMRRIEGRRGGVPKFDKIRDDLVKEYGENGAHTVVVLDKWTRQNRLHYREVNELEARQAINARRPVVATFQLYAKQWEAFSAFYSKDEGKGILKKEDLTIKGPPGEIAGHVVVLIKCDPEYLTFINSWGTNFADGGFFKVQNQAVLNLKFYDVYWTLNDLYPDEIGAFELKKQQTTENLIGKFIYWASVRSNMSKMSSNF